MTTITTTTNEQNIVEQQQSTQQTIDSNKYISKEFAKWEDLEHLNPGLLRGIYAHGFDKPSIIQQKSILSLFDKKDIIAQAQS